MSSVARPLAQSVVVVSDLVEALPSFPVQTPPAPPRVPAVELSSTCEVRGGYLHRLPLAAIRQQRARFAEIWHFHRGGEGVGSLEEDAVLTRRSFPVAGDAPFHSEAMIDFVRQHGAPAVLCVWGLGVSEAMLEACADSFIIYNSIDVPALRVPPEVSRHFDLVLTGAQWQSDEVEFRHPGMPTAILPIGPDFASSETFFPLPEPKDYDVIYVAAAQPYKRHDILFAALERSRRPLKALCVVGYGEDAERMRQNARERHLAVDFVGPPGVSHAEVNRLMNRAKVGVVCGVDDGAPAILTEYMLAGLPVVANAELRCGLQYITPQTGIAVPADRFAEGIAEALDRTDFSPRQAVLEHWTWPHSMARLDRLIAAIGHGRRDLTTTQVRDHELT